MSEERGAVGTRVSACSPDELEIRVVADIKRPDDYKAIRLGDLPDDRVHSTYIRLKDAKEPLLLGSISKKNLPDAIWIYDKGIRSRVGISSTVYVVGLVD